MHLKFHGWVKQIEPRCKRFFFAKKNDCGLHQRDNQIRLQPEKNNLASVYIFGHLNVFLLESCESGPYDALVH